MIDSNQNGDASQNNSHNRNLAGNISRDKKGNFQQHEITKLFEDN